MLIVANNLLKNIELNNLLELCFDNELLQKVDKDKIPDNNYNRLYQETLYIFIYNNRDLLLAEVKSILFLSNHNFYDYLLLK